MKVISSNVITYLNEKYPTTDGLKDCDIDKQKQELERQKQEKSALIQRMLK